MAARISRKDLYVALVSVTFVIFVVTVIITIFGIIGNSEVLPASLVQATVYYPGYTGDDFGDVSLPPWAWWIFVPIASWLVIIQIYILITVARWRTVGYLYHSPRGYMPVVVHALFLANMACFITWIFSMSWGYVDIGLGFLILSVFSMFMLQYFSWTAVEDSILDFIREGKVGEIDVIRGLVHNGNALYDTVLEVLVWYGIGQVLMMRGGVGLETAGTITLVLIMFFNIGWTIIDLLFLDKYSRYVLTPYLVYPYVLLASVLDNDEWSVSGNSSRNASLTVVSLVLACIMLAVKIIVLINRHRRCPDPLRKCNPDGADHEQASSHNNISSIEEETNVPENTDVSSNISNRIQLRVNGVN